MLYTLVVLCAVSASPQAPKPPQAPPMIVVAEKKAPSCKKEDCDCGCNDGAGCKCILAKKSCHCSPLCTCGCNDGRPCVCDTLSVTSVPTLVPSSAPLISHSSASYRDVQLYTTPVYHPPVMPAYRPMTYAAPAMSFGGGFSSGGC